MFDKIFKHVHTCDYCSASILSISHLIGLGTDNDNELTGNDQENHCSKKSKVMVIAYHMSDMKVNSLSTILSLKVFTDNKWFFRPNLLRQKFYFIFEIKWFTVKIRLKLRSECITSNKSAI